jgi:hypothetical protein
MLAMSMRLLFMKTAAHRGKLPLLSGSTRLDSVNLRPNNLLLDRLDY